MRNCSLSGAMVIQHFCASALSIFPQLTLPHTLHAHIHICIFIVCFDFISPFVCLLCFVLFLTFVGFRFVSAEELFLTLYQLHSAAMISNKLVSAAVAKLCFFLLLLLFLLCMPLPLQLALQHSINIRHLALCNFVIFYCNFIHNKWPPGRAGFQSTICILGLRGQCGGAVIEFCQSCDIPKILCNTLQ